jgi:hypothetical protein
LALLAGIATLALVIRAVCFLAAQVTLPLAEKQKKKPSQHGTPEQERAMTDEELIAMARLAQRDERMSTGALYGDLADRIEALTAKLEKAEVINGLLTVVAILNNPNDERFPEAVDLAERFSATLVEIKGESHE